MIGDIDKWLFAFIALGILATIGVIVLGSVQTADTSQICQTGTWNASDSLCINASNPNQTFPTGFSASYNASGNAATGVLNMTSQFTTAGTLVGLGILALAAILILGYFGFGKRKL